MITVHAVSNVDHILDRGGTASKVIAMSKLSDVSIPEVPIVKYELPLDPLSEHPENKKITM